MPTTRHQIAGGRAVALFLTVASVLASAGAASAEDYYFRARALDGAAPAPASAAPPAPVPAPPLVLELEIVPGTTYRTSRPLAAVLAELAAAGRAERSLQLDWRGRTLVLDWTATGLVTPQDVAAFFDTSVIQSFFPGRGRAWLDADGHLRFFETHPKTGFILSSTRGLALASYGWTPVP